MDTTWTEDNRKTMAKKRRKTNHKKTAALPEWMPHALSRFWEKCDPREKKILLCIAVLSVLALAVAVCGLRSTPGAGLPFIGGGEDPLLIQELIAGEYTAEIGKEGGEYFIRLRVRDDFSFQSVPLNLVLPKGATVSPESNCLLGEMAGRPLVHLGVSDPTLVIQNGKKTRAYRFRLELQ